MPKTTTAVATPLREQLNRLADFPPSTSPVLSLYVNLRPNEVGRETSGTFLRKTFADHRCVLQGTARASFDRDVDRILTYLRDLPRSIKAAAVFACSAEGNFVEAIPLEVPIDDHWLFVGSVPYLYPLARLSDQFPRYAALLVDTNAARLFVFSLGHLEDERRILNVKTRRGAVGGWTQARYQRHIENFHLHHIKEVVAILDRVVEEESLESIVIACDDVARAMLMEHLPKHLAAKIVDAIHLDIHSPKGQVLAETLEALRRHDGETDAERVKSLIDAWSAGGLAVIGPEETLEALSKGQVDELLIASQPQQLRPPADAAPQALHVETSAPDADLRADRINLAGDLVARAHQNNARIRIIEDSALLANVGGAGAFLRFKA